MHFERETTGETVFDVHVINLRNTYQFTPAVPDSGDHATTTARGVACSATSWRRTSSCPGTVVHAGYGSLWEGLEATPYQTTARAFFFKASYLAHAF